MRLSPLDPTQYQMHAGTGFAHLLAGRFDEASSWAEKALREEPDYLPAAAVTAASHALAGRLEEAQQAMTRLRQIDPGLRLSKLKDWSQFAAQNISPGGLTACGRQACLSDANVRIWHSFTVTACRPRVSVDEGRPAVTMGKG